MEYLLKGGFLEKFARFTDWPPESGINDPDTPFIISVIGKSPFKGSLEKIYKDGKIKGKPVRIKYIQSLDDIPGCHMLFIAESEERRLPDIVKTAETYPILMVSDTTGFAEMGCHINLYITKKGTLHFEINLNALKASGLSVQLVLLEIAKIVGG